MQPVWKRNAAIVGIIAGVYVGLKYIFPVMVPFFIGWLLAVWMYPLVCRLERKLRIKKSVWAGIFMGLLTVAAAFLLYKMGVILLQQVKAWVGNYQVVERYCVRLLDQCCCMVEQMTGIDRGDTQQFLTASFERVKKNFWDNLGTNAVIQATGYVKGIILLASGGVITVISGVLFVKDLSDIRKNLRTFRFYPRWRRVLRRLKDTGVTYIKAQLIIMFVISIISTLVLWLMRSPYYLLFGIALGVLDALPLIGTGLFLYPAAVIFFLKGETVLAVGCILIELITTVVREAMEPRLIGNQLGVYPVVIMAAIYVGFLVFGVLGFILGPAALLLIYAIGKEWDIWD